jgi:hypothetical protein
MDAPSQFIYAITTGRSGTAFLSRLLHLNLAGAEVHHEFRGFPHFGRRTPDASQLTTFNHVGNVPEVRSFWRKKFNEDQKSSARVYAEMAHVHAKAGLVENLDLLPTSVRIDLVRLERNSFETYWSHLNRFDFVQPHFTWLFNLDARYPNVIVDPAPYLPHRIFGQALWYVHEMEARGAYYQRLVVSDSRIRIHRVRFEDLVNPFGAATFLRSLGHGCDPAEVELPRHAAPSRRSSMGDAERQVAEALFAELTCDTEAAGQNYHEEGLRLGAPVHLFFKEAGALQHESLQAVSGNSKKAGNPVRAGNLKTRGLSGGAGDVGLSS